MTMHIYAFGSVCRGDILPSSDVDLLAVVHGRDARLSSDDYSIYSYARVEEIWLQGNPFAWHLALESKLLFSSDQTDFLASLGKPSRYSNFINDCEKFSSLFLEARTSLEGSSVTATFDLSMVFLAIRNFATCFSLGKTQSPNFSRRSAIRIGDYSLRIDDTAFETLERARILSTRGIGREISSKELAFAIKQFPAVQAWMECLMRNCDAE